MSETSSGSVKTLGVQLPDEVHAQFSLVCGLEDLSLKDGVRAAVDLYIATRKEALAEKANQALAEIERNAAMQRSALTALFGDQLSTDPKPAKAAGKRSSE